MVLTELWIQWILYSVLSWAYLGQARNSMSSDIWFLGGISGKTGKDQKGNNVMLEHWGWGKWGSNEAKAVENELYISAWPMTLFRGLIDLSVHRCYKLEGKTRTLIESIEKIFFFCSKRRYMVDLCHYWVGLR